MAQPGEASSTGQAGRETGRRHRQAGPGQATGFADIVGCKSRPAARRWSEGCTLSELQRQRSAWQRCRGQRQAQHSDLGRENGLMDRCLCSAADILDRPGVVFADRLRAHVPVRGRGLVGPPPPPVVFLWWQPKQNLGAKTVCSHERVYVYKPHRRDLDWRAEKSSCSRHSPGAEKLRCHYWRQHRCHWSSCALAGRERTCWKGPMMKPVNRQLPRFLVSGQALSSLARLRTQPRRNRKRGPGSCNGNDMRQMPSNPFAVYRQHRGRLMLHANGGAGGGSVCERGTEMGMRCRGKGDK